MEGVYDRQAYGRSQEYARATARAGHDVRELPGLELRERLLEAGPGLAAGGVHAVGEAPGGVELVPWREAEGRSGDGAGDVVAGDFALFGRGSPGRSDRMPTGNVPTPRCFSRCAFSAPVSMKDTRWSPGEFLSRHEASRSTVPTRSHSPVSRVRIVFSKEAEAKRRPR